MAAQLVALHDGPNILLDKPILLLGRHPECDIQIDSRKISRRHCCIAQVYDYFVVRDLASTNGVRINGMRVTEGRLAAGDELAIGNHRYRVACEVEENPPPRAAALGKKGSEGQRQVLDDDALESSDEPIALPEPGNALPSLAESSKILPEHIELMPSDVFPGVSTPPSHPSH